MPGAPGEIFPEFRKGDKARAEDMQQLVRQIRSLSVQGDGTNAMSISGVKMTGRQKPVTNTDQDLCYIRNDSGVDSGGAFYVLKITGLEVDPNDEKFSTTSPPYFTGDTVDEDDITTFAIIQESASAGAWALAVVSGCAWVRLTGETGKTHATTKDGQYTLEASDSGPCVILYDPGPENEERIARVKIGASGSPSEMVIFELVEPDESEPEEGECDCGENGWIANVLYSVCDNEYNEPITVFDKTQEFFTGRDESELAGVLGVAIKMSENSEESEGCCCWTVVALFIEQRSNFFTFLTTGNPSQGKLILSIKSTDEDDNEVTEDVEIVVGSTLGEIDTVFNNHTGILDAGGVDVISAGNADPSIASYPSRIIGIRRKPESTLSSLDVVSIDDTYLIGGSFFPVTYIGTLM